MKPTVQSIGVQCCLDTPKHVSTSSVGVQSVIDCADASIQCDVQPLSPKVKFMTSESELSDISEEPTTLSTDTCWETESS